MCGITGWIDFERDLTQEKETVATMTATMACRGPDDAGLWLSRHAALGHRRLAVIDVESGKQPLVDGPVVLVYSGEVYNFAELRAELAAYGHSFRTRSDTEVVLRAYLQWGPDAVTRLVGMFAFAIWDERCHRLLLVRDRLGVKPLYYARTTDGFVFGSEPKAIFANPLFSPEVGEQGLAELFGLWPFTTPGEAIYRGVHELLPGHILTAGPNGVTTRRYWRLENREHTDDLPTTAQTVRRLVTEAVDQQVVCDVPLAALLSGGLDSSMVAALAVTAMERRNLGKLATYAVDFVGSTEDFHAHEQTPSLDSPYVAQMVEYLGTRHTNVVIDASDLPAHEEAVIRARDLPSLGDVDISLLLLLRQLRQHAVVALSGESADEIFGGYSWFTNGASGTFPWLDPQIGYPWLRPELLDLLKLDDYVRDRYHEAIAEVPVRDGEPPEERRMRELYHLGLTRHLPAMLNRKDRMSMATGLEVRVPYCDHRLVEYVWNVPWWMKAAGGREKGLLREAAVGLLPENVRTRRKSRYPSPQTPRYMRSIWDRARDLVDDRSSPLRPLLHLPNLRWLVSQESTMPPAERAAITTPLASFLSIDTWLRMYRVRIR